MSASTNSRPARAPHLRPRKANFVPLSPLSFLVKAAAVDPKGVSIIYEDASWTWAETYARCRRFADALRRRGIETDDVVAVIAPNIPAMYEAHFGVPMAGAILLTLNTRLNAGSLGVPASPR